MPKKTILILHNIRSAQNVGAIFRTADAVGVKKIYLTGYTPDPLDRFGRKRKDISKASLGAEESVSWEHAEDIFTLVQKLKKEGYDIVALEQGSRAQVYTNASFEKAAVIVGNEVEGISQDVLALSDAVYHIPMSGIKESLNVSVAAGIFLFRLRDF